MDSQTRSGMIYIFVSTLGFACFPIFTKFIYRYSTLEPLDVVVWRYAFAIPIMWGLTLAWTRYLSPNRAAAKVALPRGRLLLTGTLFAGAALSGVFGLRYLDASLYVVLFFTYPAMTGIIAALTGHPLPARGWMALALTTVGVVLTTPDVLSLNMEGALLLGVSIALLNALVVALYMTWMGNITVGFPATPLTTAYSLTGALIVVIPLAVLLGVNVPDTPTIWLLFLGLSALGTTLPIFGLIMGVSKLGASRAAIIGTLEPAIVILMAFLLLGERLLPVQIFGALLIIISIVILEVRPRRRAASVTTVTPESS